MKTLNHLADWLYSLNDYQLTALFVLVGGTLGGVALLLVARYFDRHPLPDERS